MNPLSPISLETVLEIHRLKVVKYGGLAGLRDKGLLEAAIAQPWQSFDGIDLYPSLPEKAARIGFEVITQHPFNDGNKRTGAALVGVLLRANGVNFTPRSIDYVDAILGVADGSLDYAEFLEFVRNSIS